MDTIVTLNVALDRPLYDRMCALAEASGRSTSWLIDQALRSYIDRHADLAGHPAGRPPAAGAAAPAPDRGARSPAGRSR